MKSIAAFVRLTLGITILTTVEAIEPALARKHADTIGSRSTLTLLVYNYAEIDASTIAGAENEAARPFARAGVTLMWHACLGRGQAVPDPACSSAEDPTVIEVRLVKRIPKVSGLSDDAPLGYATGQVATISYEKVREIGMGAPGDEVCALGFAMAHELGHVLMPGLPHSVDGILRRGWSIDLSRILQGSLNFNANEKALIRAEAKRRSSANAVVSVASER